MKGLRFIIPLAVFGVLVAFLAVGLKLNPREVPSPLIGKPAPGVIRRYVAPTTTAVAVRPLTSVPSQPVRENRISMPTTTKTLMFS